MALKVLLLFLIADLVPIGSINVLLLLFRGDVLPPLRQNLHVVFEFSARILILDAFSDSLHKEEVGSQPLLGLGHYLYFLHLPRLPRPLDLLNHLFLLPILDLALSFLLLVLEPLSSNDLCQLILIIGKARITPTKLLDLQRTKLLVLFLREGVLLWRLF
mmetsp:Transcript_36081/g.35061  ORF Transcript_36081/g.35061 Transcript_36081/m.35061 type:complete len:160 (-) Transcript_36081:160-639(-)